MADPGSHPDGDAQDLVEPGLAERADALIARGLERYGEGDLEGALGEWEHARALVPDCAAAEEYIQYVRDNFDLLDEQFQHAREVALAASEAGVPLGGDDEPAGEGDYGYEELEVTSSDAVGHVGADAAKSDSVRLDEADTTQEPAVTPLWGQARKDDSSVDDGWALDGLGGGLGGGFDGGFDAAPESPVTDVAGDPTSDAADAGLDEQSSAGGAPPPDAGAGPVSIRAESSFDLASVSSAMLDLDDLPQGYRLRPRGSRHASVPEVRNDDEQTVPGGRTPPPLADQPRISQDVLDAIEGVAADLEREQATDSADDDSADDDSGDDDNGDQQDTADFDRDHLRRQLDGSSDFHQSETPPPMPVSVTFHDVGTSEKTMPSRQSTGHIDFSGLDIEGDGGVDLDDLPSAADLDLGPDASRDDEEPTRERASVVASWQDFGSPGSTSESASDEESTRQRTFTTGATAEGEPGLSAVQLDDQLLSQTASRADLDQGSQVPLSGGGAGADLESETRKLVAVEPIGLADYGDAVTADNVDAIAREFRDGLDEGAPAGEADSERVRRRVLALLDQSRTEQSADRPLLAAVLAEYAVVEAPDSAVGQKLVHQHRNVVLEVFRSYVGDPAAIPMVTVPMHQVAELEIDSRAAFLLSRIDGTLSFEEILDVCGMPELEAYCHLTRLLVAGILDVR